MEKNEKRSKSIFTIEILIVVVLSFFLLNYISVSQNSEIKIQNVSKPLIELNNKATNKVQNGVFNSLGNSNINISALNSTQNQYLGSVESSLYKFKRILGVGDIEVEIPNSIISTKEASFK